MVCGSSSAAVPVAPITLGKRTGLPLVPCPTCGADIVELTCGPDSKVPCAIFFKCQFHERDVPGSCPWYLFANKYEQMLVAKGMIQKKGTVVACMRPEILPGQIEGLVESNNTEMVPFLGDAVPVKSGTERVLEKLQKLILLGKIGAVCLVVVAVFVVVGVIIMLVK